MRTSNDTASGQAQEALFHTQYARVAGWAGALLDDQEAGHDVAAEAFTRLIARWGSAREPAALLWTVAANLVRDRWRRDRSRSRGLRLLRDSTPPADVPAHDPSIRDLVMRLPAAARVPVLLHYYADMTAEDIARHLNRPSGTVRRQLTEARRSLRKQLEDADA